MVVSVCLRASVCCCMSLYVFGALRVCMCVLLHDSVRLLRERDRETTTATDRRAERERDTEIERDTERDRERQIDRERDVERERESGHRERDRKRERERDTKYSADR